MASASDADRNAAAAACRGLLRALLHDFPELAQGELNDGTPVANAETRGWITSEILAIATAAEPAAYPAPRVALPPAPEADRGTVARAEVALEASAVTRTGAQVSEADPVRLGPEN